MTAKTAAAKQSQFRASKIPHHSTIPSSQHSSLVPVARNKANLHPHGGIGGASPTLQAGAIAPNEPNSAWSRGQTGVPERKRAKTKPISVRMDRQGPAPPAPSVQNKAKLGRTGVCGPAWPANGMCETKPISRSRPGRPWYWDPKRDRSRLGRGPQRGGMRWGAPTHSWARRPCYGTPCGVSPPARG